MLSHFSHAGLFATLWTVAHQIPLSVGFSKNTAVDCPAFLQGISPTPDWTCTSYIPCFGRQIPYRSCYLGSPNYCNTEKKRNICFPSFSFLEFIYSSLLNANATFIIHFSCRGDLLYIYIIFQPKFYLVPRNSSCLIFDITFCCTEYQPYGRHSIIDSFFCLLKGEKKDKMTKSKCLIRWY